MHLSVLYLLSQKGSNISPHSWLHASAAPGYPEEHSFPSIQHSPWISERCVKSVARSHAAAGACASAVGGVPATKRRKNAVSAVRLVKRITGATSCAAATPALRGVRGGGFVDQLRLLARCARATELRISRLRRNQGRGASSSTDRTEFGDDGQFFTGCHAWPSQTAPGDGNGAEPGCGAAVRGVSCCAQPSCPVHAVIEPL